MSKRGNVEFLYDIKEAIRRIESFVGNMDYAEFLNDIKTQDAVIRNIEIIGEAIKNLTDELKEKHKEIEWRKIAAMRDKIIHFYFGINLEIIWDTIKVKIPEFKEKIENIIKELEKYET